MHVLILEASFFRRVHYWPHRIALRILVSRRKFWIGLDLFSLLSSWGIPGMGIFISRLLAPYILDLTFDCSGI